MSEAIFFLFGIIKQLIHEKFEVRLNLFSLKNLHFNYIKFVCYNSVIKDYI